MNYHRFHSFQTAQAIHRNGKLDEVKFIDNSVVCIFKDTYIKQKHKDYKQHFGLLYSEH